MAEISVSTPSPLVNGRYAKAHSHFNMLRNRDHMTRKNNAHESDLSGVESEFLSDISSDLL